MHLTSKLSLLHAIDPQGKVSFANGDSYAGELSDGLFHGEGHYKYAGQDGKAFYKGQFQRGDKHGRGTRVFSNGSKYDGKFWYNEMQGHGIMNYGNGDLYIVSEGEMIRLWLLPMERSA